MVALAACASIASEKTGVTEVVSPAEIVSARQAALHMSGATIRSFRQFIASGGDVKTQVYAARGLARWARVLPTMFPESTASITPSRARPEIWANKAYFNQKAAAYAEAAARLPAAAETGDRATFEAAWKATAATCGACHDFYQVPLPQQ